MIRDGYAVFMIDNTGWDFGTLCVEIVAELLEVGRYFTYWWRWGKNYLNTSMGKTIGIGLQFDMLY